MLLFIIFLGFLFLTGMMSLLTILSVLYVIQVSDEFFRDEQKFQTVNNSTRPKPLTASRRLLLLLSFISRQINRPVQSSLACLGFSKPPEEETFFNVDPQDDGFNCLAVTKKGPCCFSPIKSSDKKLASRLRESLSTLNPYHPTFGSQLVGYLNLCYCSLHRGTNPANLSLKRIKDWQEELKRLWKEELEKCKFEQDLLEIEGMANLESPIPKSAWNKDIKMPIWLKAKECWKTIPRTYHARFFLSQPERTSAIDSVKTAQFSRYERSHKSVSLYDIITKDLSLSDSQDGNVYIYQRATDDNSKVRGEEYVKIGFTIQEPWERFVEIEKSCGYKPILLKHFWVKHAKRVESLIHLDLEINKSTRRIFNCQSDNGCKKIHREWFEVSKEEAQETVKYWCDWMTRLMPYDEYGVLKTKYLRSMFRSGMRKNSQEDSTGFNRDSGGKLWHQDGLRPWKKEVATANTDNSRSYHLATSTSKTSMLDSSTPLRLPGGFKGLDDSTLEAVANITETGSISQHTNSSRKPPHEATSYPDTDQVMEDVLPSTSPTSLGPLTEEYLEESVRELVDSIAKATKPREKIIKLTKSSKPEKSSDSEDLVEPPESQRSKPKQRLIDESTSPKTSSPKSLTSKKEQRRSTAKEYLSTSPCVPRKSSSSLRKSSSRSIVAEDKSPSPAAPSPRFSSSKKVTKRHAANDSNVSDEDESLSEPEYHTSPSVMTAASRRRSSGRESLSIKAKDSNRKTKR